MYKTGKLYIRKGEWLFSYITPAEVERVMFEMSFECREDADGVMTQYVTYLNEMLEGRNQSNAA